MVKISFGSWAFSLGPYAHDPVPLERIATRLGEAEYDGVELGGSPGEVTLALYPGTLARARLTRMLKDNGLAVSGYAADFREVNPLVASNKQGYIELFQRYLELCRDIRSPMIRVDTVGAPGSLPEWEYQRAIDRLADIWTSTAEIAAAARVRVVWGFEPGCVCNKPSEVLALHRRVNHPNFRILFDTSHAYMSAVAGARQRGNRETLHGGVPEFLKRLEGRVGAVHVMDSDGTLYKGGTSTHRPFGEGNIDFRSLAPQLLDEAQVDWWCVDLCCWPGAWELIDTSRDFVLGLLNAKTAA